MFHKTFPLINYQLSNYREWNGPRLNRVQWPYIQYHICWPKCASGQQHCHQAFNEEEASEREKKEHSSPGPYGLTFFFSFFFVGGFLKVLLIIKICYIIVAYQPIAQIEPHEIKSQRYRMFGLKRHDRGLSVPNDCFSKKKKQKKKSVSNDCVSYHESAVLCLCLCVFVFFPLNIS